MWAHRYSARAWPWWPLWPHEGANKYLAASLDGQFTRECVWLGPFKACVSFRVQKWKGVWSWQRHPPAIKGLLWFLIFWGVEAEHHVELRSHVEETFYGSWDTRFQATYRRVEDTGWINTHISDGDRWFQLCPLHFVSPKKIEHQV